MSRCFKSFLPAIFAAALLASGLPRLALADTRGLRVDDSQTQRKKAFEFIGKYPELVQANLEMKTLYLALMDRFPSTQKMKLSQMQRDWEWSRDRDCNYSEQGNEYRHGTCNSLYMYRIAQLKAFPPEPAFSELTKSICLEREDCLVIKQQSAGQNRQGNHLWIVQVSPSTPTPRGETWLTVMGEGKVLHKQKLINDTCCDDALNDAVQIGTHTITIAWTGGANGHGYDFRVWNLDPLKPVIYSAGGSGGGTQWNWDSFTGSGSNNFSRYVDEEKGEVEGQRKCILIPEVPIDGDFWDKNVLGNCSVDLNAKNGFLLKGHMAQSSTFELKALLIRGHILIVNVYSNTEAEGAANWRNDDQMEYGIYTGNYSPFDRWAIRMSDGKVVPSVVNSSDIPGNRNVRIKDLLDPKGRRVRVLRIEDPQLPTYSHPDYFNLGSILFRYSARDDHNKVKWVLSTSQIKGDDMSSGDIQPIDPKFATCVPENGVLNVKRATEFNENEPLF